MAFIQDGRAATGNIAVENTTKSARVSVVSRGNRNHAISFSTGTMATAALANSTFFAMRLNPSYALNAYIQRIRLNFTTIAAFATPITSGRRLTVSRATGAAATTGTAIATPAAKLSSVAASGFSAASGGDIRYGVTTGLTTTGMTFEAEPFTTMSLAHVGAAGASFEQLVEFSGENAPFVLEPGQLLVIRNPQLMDLGGTWQLTLTIHWSEDLPLTSSVADS